MTSHAVTFDVVGIAQPKGSTKAFMRPGMKFPIVTSDNKSVKGWETNVRSAAQQHCGGVFFDECAVRVAIVFYLPRPTSLPKKVKQHVKKPDVDKLCRAACDALKGVLWKDDSQVVDLVARKRYALAQPYARISVDYAELPQELAVEQDLFAPLNEVRA